MEGQRLATGPDPLHFRYWRQSDRVCGEKDHERVVDSAGLALGDLLFPAHYPALAPGCVADQYPFWPVSFFQQVYPEDRSQDRSREEGVLSREA